MSKKKHDDLSKQLNQIDKQVSYIQQKCLDIHELVQSDRKILEKARCYDNIQRQVDISGDFLKYVVKDSLKEIQNTIDSQPVDDHGLHDIDKIITLILAMTNQS